MTIPTERCTQLNVAISCKFPQHITVKHQIRLPLKMIGKGFVLFKINSSPTAFYTIKPICIIVIGFNVSNYF